MDEGNEEGDYTRDAQIVEMDLLSGVQGSASKEIEINTSTM